MVLTANQVRINQYTITVGLGELSVTKDPKVSLACFGLGSCICVCAYEPLAKVSGMVHIVLPKSNKDSDRTATKFADIAVPVLIEEMIKAGAIKTKLDIKLVGGARMIKSYVENDAFDMGNRNLEMVKKLLTEQQLQVSATDTGGDQGRSVWMLAETGKVLVRKAGEELHEL